MQELTINFWSSALVNIPFLTTRLLWDTQAGVRGPLCNSMTAVWILDIDIRNVSYALSLLPFQDITFLLAAQFPSKQ